MATETEPKGHWCFGPSEDIVSREIEGELIIVPLVSGIGDAEDDLFTLNASGKAVWKKLDGKRTLDGIIEELAQEYDAPGERITEDVKGLVSELLKRRMIVRVDG